MSSSKSSELAIDLRSTALVLIDLQKGIVARQTAPYPAAEFAVIRREHDAPAASGPAPPDFGEIVKELGPKEGDLVITKRQWGAFYGTELDLQLRRRKLDTILLGGISTNFGVESTGRAAWEQAYQVVFVEDAMAGLTVEAHQFAVKTIFPRIGRVRSTEQVLNARNATDGGASHS